MTTDELIIRLQRAKQLGKTRACQDVVKIVKLPYDLVWGALMGGTYLTNALKRVDYASLEAK